LYADQHFQIDAYFPFIAFDQQQFRDTFHGGYLLTDRRNFSSVADCILSIQTDILQWLVNHALSVSFLKLMDKDEACCFELISVLNHVSGHVDGSLARRKQMCSEIRSLIITMNVPIFFITFSPVDINHLLCLYYCGE
ncbi:uncharacterized protein LAESUDRAFT_665263, partial [Laetiporus sulphureus 93-53]